MPENTDLLGWLGARRSIKPKYLTAPIPDAATWDSITAAAAAVPDHGHLRPFRFALLTQDERAALADLFEAACRRAGGDEEAAQKARSKALKGPGMAAFVVITTPDERVPEFEQILTAGAALGQFMQALRAAGFGGIVLSGSALKDHDVQAALCREPGERLAAWIVVGTPEEASSH
ncbi:MAG: nitroreductase family protein [Duodenibacillus sp.]